MTEITVRYVGGPTALLEIGPWRLLTDPTFDAAGGRYLFGWGTASRKLQGPAYTMNGPEAIDLCRELAPETIVPLHFEGWRHFRQSREDVVAQLAASRFASRVRWPVAGESLTLEV